MSEKQFAILTLKDNTSALVVEVGDDDTNETLIDVMRAVMVKRKEGIEHAACMVGGFDDDKRELHEIPKARTFLDRLHRIGFISVLDYSTVLPPHNRIWMSPPPMGAFEIWLATTRQANAKGVDVSRDMLKRFERVLRYSNATADDLMNLPPELR
jgi:hypothetical protein